jgi:hypothetical protein
MNSSGQATKGDHLARCLCGGPTVSRHKENVATYYTSSDIGWVGLVNTNNEQSTSIKGPEFFD